MDSKFASTPFTVTVTRCISVSKDTKHEIVREYVPGVGKTQVTIPSLNPSCLTSAFAITDA